jgi:hypothetical protein
MSLHFIQESAKREILGMGIHLRMQKKEALRNSLFLEILPGNLIIERIRA